MKPEKKNVCSLLIHSTSTRASKKWWKRSAAFIFNRFDIISTRPKTAFARYNNTCKYYSTTHGDINSRKTNILGMGEIIHDLSSHHFVILTVIIYVHTRNDNCILCIIYTTLITERKIHVRNGYTPLYARRRWVSTLLAATYTQQQPPPRSLTDPAA